VPLLAFRLIWRLLKRRALKAQGHRTLQPRLAEYEPPQNSAPEEKSWSDCGLITLLWGLLKDFLSFPARRVVK
jgi:hypothetical protein